MSKVYVIDEPRKNTSKKRDTPRPLRKGVEPVRAHTMRTKRPANPLVTLRTYALGPLNLILWPKGRGRLAWGIVGAGSLVATTLLWMQGGMFARSLQALPHGVAVWLMVVPVVILLTATACARAVAVADRVSTRRRRVRNAALVGLLGIVFPGLGLLIAGRKRQAALAIWCMGILVAAVTVLANWRWLVAHGGAKETSVAPQSIEIVLIIAAGGVLFGLLAWLVQVLDGVRAVSPASRSGAAGGLVFVLLVTMFLGISAFRPASFARDLGAVAGTLEDNGLRMIAVTLYEVTSVFDPAVPMYLVSAAALYDDLGRPEAADSKRALLQVRAARFADALDARLIPRRTYTLPPWWFEDGYDRAD